MTTVDRSLRFEGVGGTHPGITRANRPNQDVFEVCRDLWAAGDLLVVVADGMGGAAAGERASRAALEAVVQTEVVAPPQTEPERGSGADPAVTLQAACDRANEAVRRIDGGDATRRPGTTLVLAYFLGTSCWVANVGDSRCYRLRGPTLERLTHDHSLVQEEVDAGRLTEAEAREDPRSALITRTIGGQPSVEADQAIWPLEDGDCFLTCSDGLWGVLDDRVIAEVLAAHADEPADAVGALIEASLEAGGPDNITAAVVRVRAGP